MSSWCVRRSFSSTSPVGADRPSPRCRRLRLRLGELEEHEAQRVSEAARRVTRARRARRAVAPASGCSVHAHVDELRHHHHVQPVAWARTSTRACASACPCAAARCCTDRRRSRTRSPARRRRSSRRAAGRRPDARACSGSRARARPRRAACGRAARPRGRGRPRARGAPRGRSPRAVAERVQRRRVERHRRAEPVRVEVRVVVLAAAAELQVAAVGVVLEVGLEQDPARELLAHRETARRAFRSPRAAGRSSSSTAGAPGRRA